MRRPSLLLAAAVLAAALVGCGASRPPVAALSTPGGAGSSTSTSSAAPTVSPSGPITPTAGEDATTFWARRGVKPAPPAGFLDAYAALPLPAVSGSSATVRAALRELAGEAYVVDHLRLDIVESGVLGAPGLSGDDTSVIQAQNAGLSGTTTTLQAVQAAAVVTLSAAQSKTLDTTIVVLRLQYGPFVGHYTNGTSKTLPATGPQTEALAGHLVSSSLLGTYLYLTGAVDCGSAAAGSASASACAKLS